MGGILQLISFNYVRVYLFFTHPAPKSSASTMAVLNPRFDASRATVCLSDKGKKDKRRRTKPQQQGKQKQKKDEKDGKED